MTIDSELPSAASVSRALSERRKYRRIDIEVPVAVARRPGDPSVQGRSIDLSPFGMKVLMKTPLEEDEVAEVSISLPAGPVATGAIVVRCKPEGMGYRVSFAFFRLDRVQFARLRDFVDAERA